MLRLETEQGERRTQRPWAQVAGAESRRNDLDQAVTGGDSDEEFRDMLVTIRTRVAALKQQGKSLAGVLTAKPTAAYDAR